MKARKKSSLWTSEKALEDVEAVTLALESGRIATFRIASELAVSDDPVELRQQAEYAHSRFAFWSYQAARAMRDLRTAELAVSKSVGERRYSYSRTLKEEDPYVSATTVDGLVDSSPDVIALREKANDLRYHWSVLKAVADALDHRAHLLRRLLAGDQESIRG